MVPITKANRGGLAGIFGHLVPRRQSTREAIAGYLFVLPVILGFLIWVFGPMVATLGISFTNWPIIGKAKWIGLDNYTRLFTTDPFFFAAFKASTYFAVVSVALRIVYTFLVALLLNQDVRGKALFRTIYYLPSIVPVVASSMIWSWVYDPDFGLFNVVLKWMGLPTSRWISDPKTVIPSIILMDLWASSSTIIIFLAGLQGVPRELLEAVEVDGGNAWHKLWAVTIPHMSPFIFFNIVLGLIGAFQIFTQSFIMTGGGPNNASLFFALLIYRTAFTNNKMGLACALAWILFMIVAFFTFVIFKSSGSWVFYYGDDR
jgi:multiple sugar transport system permease protein